MAPAQGFATQLGIGAASPVDVRLNFQSASLKAMEERNWRGGIRGRISRDVTLVNDGLVRVDGDIVLNPTVAEFAAVAPWMLGATPTGTAYPLGTTLAEKYVAVDLVEKVVEYSGLKVVEWRLSGSTGSALQLTLVLAGKNYTVGNAGTMPSLSFDSTTRIPEHFNCVGIVNGVTVQFSAIELVCRNISDLERFLNSQTRTDIALQDREITVSLSPPWGGNAALFDLSSAGVAVSATWTVGNTSIAAAMPKVVFDPVLPDVPGKTELFLPLRGTAFSNGTANDELAFTIDPNPA